MSEKKKALVVLAVSIVLSELEQVAVQYFNLIKLILSRHPDDEIAFFVSICVCVFESQRPRSLYYHSKEWISQVVPKFGEKQFFEHFRMRKSSFLLLLSRLEPIYEASRKEFGRKHPPAFPSLLLFLYYLAGNGFLSEIGDVFGFSKSMVWKICARWRGIIIDSLSHLIVRPKTQAQWKRLAQYNGKSFGKNYPNVLGLIDGTHISIPAPSHQHEAYFNRKKRYSIICQGLVDCNGIFIDVNVGQPGCCHDAYVLRSSSLLNDMGSIPPGYYILGDTAYPNRECLLTPYKEGQYEGLSAIQVRRYNRALSNIRVTVEQSYGRLKGRVEKIAIHKWKEA